MELDNIKSLWDKEIPAETPEISLEKQKEIRMPLEKIRKNMRVEFYSSIVAILFLAFGLEVFSDNYLIRWSLFFVMVFVTVYFFIRFYSLYKKLRFTDLATFEKLLELKYEIKANIDLYKSYYISFVPIFYALLLLFLEKHNFFKYDDQITHFGPFIIFFAVVATTLGFGKWWWDNFYNRYLKEIEKIIKDLK